MHENYEQSEFINGLGPWLLIAVVAGLIGLGVGLWFFLKKRSGPPATTGNQPKGDEETAPAGTTVPPQEPAPVQPSGGQSLSPEQSEIFNMLRLPGGAMTQLEIAEQLPVDQEEIAETLDILEARGTIERRWDGQQRTFSVVATQG